MKNGQVPTRSILLALFLLLVSSCQSVGPVVKKVENRDSNGNLYCTGQRLFKKANADSVDIGIWKYYYPSTVQRCEIEYDSTGSRIRDSYYDEIGRLSSNSSIDGETEIESEYFGEGKLKTLVVTQSHEEDENTTTHMTLKQFHSNGKLWREVNLNEENDGSLTVWDTTGNQILKLKYVNGMEQQ